MGAADVVGLAGTAVLEVPLAGAPVVETASLEGKAKEGRPVEASVPLVELAITVLVGVGISVPMVAVEPAGAVPVPTSPLLVLVKVAKPVEPGITTVVLFPKGKGAVVGRVVGLASLRIGVETGTWVAGISSLPAV